MSKRPDLPLHTLAYAAATDLANAQMRAAERQHWSEKDYNAAVAEYHRLNPCPADVDCELCNTGEKQP